MSIKKRAAALFLVCLTFLLPLSAYAEAGTALQASAFGNVNTVSGLTLAADKKSYSPYLLELTLRFQNKTYRDYDFDAEYDLERYLDGQWYTWPRSAAFASPAVGFYLAAKKSLKHTFRLTDAAGFNSGRGPIEAGRWRVVWPLQDAQTNNTVYLAAEFLVEDSFLYAKEPVNLRSGPGTEYDILRELDLGERVSAIQKSGKWTLVRAGAHTGYVYGKYLTKDEASCYYNHFAVKLLREKDARSVRAIRVYDGVSRHSGRGDVFYESERFVSVELAKPYASCSLHVAIAVYPDEAAAQKKFREIEEGVLFPDAVNQYYIKGRYIVCFGWNGLVDFTARAELFRKSFQYKMREACEAVAG